MLEVLRFEVESRNTNIVKKTGSSIKPAFALWVKNLMYFLSLLFASSYFDEKLKYQRDVRF